MLKHLHFNEIDPDTEPLITLKGVCKLPQTHLDGKGPHLSTPFRWMKNGIRVGDAIIYLESRKVGCQLCTSAAAVDRFLARLSGQPAPKVSPRQRETALSKLERDLEKAGV